MRYPRLLGTAERVSGAPVARAAKGESHAEEDIIATGRSYSALALA